MKFTAALIAAAIAATPALAQTPAAAPAAPAAAVTATAGKMLYSADGKRIGSIYRVTADGSPQLILDGRLVTVPVASLTSENGRIMTSKSKADLRRGG